MFFTRHYFNLTEDSEFYAHRHMLNKFIDKYIKYYHSEISNIANIEKAIIYSKYYFYYKNLNCSYDESIMKILITIDNI